MFNFDIIKISFLCSFIHLFSQSLSHLQLPCSIYLNHSACIFILKEISLSISQVTFTFFWQTKFQVTFHSRAANQMWHKAHYRGSFVSRVASNVIVQDLIVTQQCVLNNIHIYLSTFHNLIAFIYLFWCYQYSTKNLIQIHRYTHTFLTQLKHVLYQRFCMDKQKIIIGILEIYISLWFLY